jgi:hypothetical protein
LDGSSVTATLARQTVKIAASIEICQMASPLEMRCNEEVSAPLAGVALSGISPSGEDFAKPLFPWPHTKPALTVDGAQVARGWEYSIAYWVEGGKHNVIIPQSSRSGRNLAFLEPDEELVMVAPLSALEFAWRDGEQAPMRTVEARVSWRKRPDGTRG